MKDTSCIIENFNFLTKNLKEIKKQLLNSLSKELITCLY